MRTVKAISTKSTKNLTSDLNQTLAIGIGSLVVMNFATGILALIAHLFLLLVLGKLSKNAPFLVRAILFPVFGIAWLWFFASACWTLTIGFLF